MKEVFFECINVKNIASGAEVCWPPYGCFNDDQPFDNNWVQLPQSPQYLNTKFMLYTRKESTNPQILSDLDANTISISHFDGRKKTVIMCHGYLGKYIAITAYYVLNIDQSLQISPRLPLQPSPLLS